MENARISRRTFFQLSAGGVAVAGAAGGYLRFLSPPEAAESSFLRGQTVSGGGVDGTAKALGHDWKRIFEFVQKEISYEPYAGLLRGARGTLLARAGNSVDQAMLLAELLRASSIQVRFVSGTLDSAAARALMALTVTDADKGRRQIDLAILAPNSVLGAKPHLSALREAVAGDVKASATSAGAQLNSSVASIMKALTGAGVSVPGAVTGLPPMERSVHTWVQAQIGTGWMDLDPTFAAAQAGNPVTAPSAPTDAIPDDQRHRVTFTVIAESLTSGKLVQEPILEASAFADEMLNTNVLFTHVPADRMSGIKLIGAGQGKRYNPILLIGPTAHVGRKSVSIGGDAGAASAVVDALSGGGSDAGLSEGEASAEWLEVGLRSPGAAASASRREVFDRIGLSARQRGPIAVEAVPVAELVDMKDGGGTHFPPCRSLWGFSVSSGVVSLESLIANAGSDGSPPVSALAGGYEILRHLFGAAIAEHIGCRPFTASPHIASWVIDAKPGGFVHGLDIWHRGFGTLAVRDRAAVAPPALIAGVLAHVVERTVLGDRISAGTTPDEGPISVGAVFEKAASQGIPTRALSGTIPADVSYESGHRARIQNALEAGFVVVAPERAVDFGGQPRLGWWLVNPETGSAADELDNGRGAVMQGDTDYMVITPAKAVFVTGVAAYGWAVLNAGIAYLRLNGPNPNVSGSMTRLFDALMAMNPAGGAGS